MHHSASPHSKLLWLPNELISAVFNALDNMYDAICLSLADGRLFAVGFSRVVELQTAQFASWAGQRVICLGKYTTDNDYPTSVSGYVKEELRRANKVDADSDDSDLNEGSGEDETEAHRRSDFVTLVRRYYEQFSSGEELQNEADFDDLYYRIRARDREPYRFLTQPQYPSRDQLILCNLSKSEYVRNVALQELAAEDADDDSHKYYTLQTVTLAHALLSRICWSMHPSISMQYDKNIHRGLWAGDKFEVTTMDKLTSDIE